MKLCILGAGAIGSVVGARLALAGEDVTLIVRNAAQRQAIQERGLTLREPNGEERVATTIRAVASAEEAGPHDTVLLSVKAQQVAAAAPAIPALLGPETTVISLQNGIPWWYFQHHGGPYEGRRFASLDPEGAIEALIPSERLLGGVVYLASEVAGPGIVEQRVSGRILLGEIDGRPSARGEAVAAALVRAGFEAAASTEIRREIWLKAWGNLCFNPIGALTHARNGMISDFGPARALAARMMAEAEAIAAKLGVTLPMSVEQRLDQAQRVAHHRSSMLQDAEGGRSLEVEAVVGAFAELGRITGTPTPNIDAVYALAKLFDTVITGERVGFPARAV